MKLTHETTTSMLKMEFHLKLKSRFFEFVKNFTYKKANFIEKGEYNPAKEHELIADKLRASKFYKELYQTTSQFSVENITIFSQPEWNPFFFEEIYEQTLNFTNHDETVGYVSIHPVQKASFNKKIFLKNLYQSKIMKEKKLHLVVLVHGYQGSKYDMRTLQNYIAKIIPHSVILVATSNEKIENQKISTMGKSLSVEIENFIKNKNNISKISFIGHSLGGIVIREALTHLNHLSKMMYSFVSLSTPHLGCRKNKSILVSLGMKYLNKVKNDMTITELQMDEASSIEKSYLYNLSLRDRLFWFKNIILVSSPQDSYVPHSSARIQPKRPNPRSNSEKAMWEMGKNIWEKVQNDSIVRLDIDLRSEKK